MPEKLSEDVIGKIREMKDILDGRMPEPEETEEEPMSLSEIVPISEVEAVVGVDDFNKAMEEAIKEGLLSAKIVSDTISREGNAIIKTVTFMICSKHPVETGVVTYCTVAYRFEIRLDSHYGAMVAEAKEQEMEDRKSARTSGYPFATW